MIVDFLASYTMSHDFLLSLIISMATRGRSLTINVNRIGLSVCVRTFHCSCEDRQHEKHLVLTKSNPLNLNVHLFLLRCVQVLLPMSSRKHLHPVDCLLWLLAGYFPAAYWLSMHVHCHMVVCLAYQPVFPSVGQLTTQLLMPQHKFPWRHMRHFN